MPGFDSDFKIRGFLDSRPITNSTYPIIGNPETYIPDSEEELVIALSDPKAKKQIASTFKIQGASFFSVIHPQNSISKDLIAGEGLIIAPFNSVSCNVIFGSFVTLYGFCKIGHDVEIGDYCHLASHCSIDGFTKISESQSIQSFSKYNKNSIL
jgi:UDP-3-O-[3-hydroxymyristoyl] glucosamine N-acyltransferase